MSWNYRIMRHEVDGEVWYGVHEVFYDEDGSVSWTTKPVFGPSETADDLIASAEMLLKDIKKYKESPLEYGDES